MTFREAVLQTADKANQVLPDNASRIDKAIQLALTGSVEMVDSHCRVASQVDGKTMYYQVNGQCQCQDFLQGKAPQGYCKHRLAHGLYRRAMELVEAQKEQHSLTLPEAPASVNVRILVAGRECQITLRDNCEKRLLGRLEHVLAQFPTEAPAQVREGFCALHHITMTKRHGKYGEFWSHKTREGWCQGKQKQGS